jgi:hypothetical protein
MGDTIQIRPVSREMVKLVIDLASVSGDGKTRSALRLAHGLTDFKPEKIGLLDTENRRGSLYSDIFAPKRFQIGDLIPPFSPERYIRAMRQFADQDIEVLIIDSISHEWEGEGGCEDIAESALQRGNKVKDWIGAKREHKRFMNTLLFLPMHIICCVRAREKTDFKHGPKPVSLGIQPICEKNFMFEATLSFMLKNRGLNREILKLNAEHEALVGTDGYLTEDHGKNLRDWIGGFDPTEKAQSTLRLAASQGTESLKTAWSILPVKMQKDLRVFKDTLKDLAAHADSEAAPVPASDGERIVW